MAFSVYDKISRDLSLAIRKITDDLISVMGTEVQVLHISRSEPDVLNNYTESLTSGVISHVIISHPLGGNNIIFTELENSQLNIDSIDLGDLLPFSMRVSFESEQNNVINIKKGDLIIDVLFDHNNNPIPLIFEVTEVFGGFFHKNLVKKSYNLALYRETPSLEIQTTINNYINSFSTS